MLLLFSFLFVHSHSLDLKKTIQDDLTYKFLAQEVFDMRWHVDFPGENWTTFDFLTCWYPSSWDDPPEEELDDYSGLFYRRSGATNSLSPNMELPVRRQDYGDDNDDDISGELDELQSTFSDVREQSRWLTEFLNYAGYLFFEGNVANPHNNLTGLSMVSFGFDRHVNDSFNQNNDLVFFSGLVPVGQRSGGIVRLVTHVWVNATSKRITFGQLLEVSENDLRAVNEFDCSKFIHPADLAELRPKSCELHLRDIEIEEDCISNGRFVFYYDNDEFYQWMTIGIDAEDAYRFSPNEEGKVISMRVWGLQNVRRCTNYTGDGSNHTKVAASAIEFMHDITNNLGAFDEYMYEVHEGELCITFTTSSQYLRYRIETSFSMAVAIALTSLIFVIVLFACYTTVPTCLMLVLCMCYSSLFCGRFEEESITKVVPYRGTTVSASNTDEAKKDDKKRSNTPWYNIWVFRVLQNFIFVIAQETKEFHQLLLILLIFWNDDLSDIAIPSSADTSSMILYRSLLFITLACCVSPVVIVCIIEYLIVFFTLLFRGQLDSILFSCVYITTIRESFLRRIIILFVSIITYWWGIYLWFLIIVKRSYDSNADIFLGLDYFAWYYNWQFDVPGVDDSSTERTTWATILTVTLTQIIPTFLLIQKAFSALKLSGIGSSAHISKSLKGNMGENPKFPKLYINSIISLFTSTYDTFLEDVFLPLSFLDTNSRKEVDEKKDSFEYSHFNWGYLEMCDDEEEIQTLKDLLFCAKKSSFSDILYRPLPSLLALGCVLVCGFTGLSMVLSCFLFTFIIPFLPFIFLFAVVYVIYLLSNLGNSEDKNQNSGFFTVPGKLSGIFKSFIFVIVNEIRTGYSFLMIWMVFNAGGCRYVRLEGFIDYWWVNMVIFITVVAYIKAIVILAIMILKHKNCTVFSAAITAEFLRECLPYRLVFASINIVLWAVCCYVFYGLTYDFVIDADMSPINSFLDHFMRVAKFVVGSVMIAYNTYKVLNYNESGCLRYYKRLETHRDPNRNVVNFHEALSVQNFCYASYRINVPFSSIFSMTYDSFLSEVLITCSHLKLLSNINARKNCSVLSHFNWDFLVKFKDQFQYNGLRNFLFGKEMDAKVESYKDTVFYDSVLTKNWVKSLFYVITGKKKKQIVPVDTPLMDQKISRDSFTSAKSEVTIPNKQATASEPQVEKATGITLVNKQDIELPQQVIVNQRTSFTNPPLVQTSSNIVPVTRNQNHVITQMNSVPTTHQTVVRQVQQRTIIQQPGIPPPPIVRTVRVNQPVRHSVPTVVVPSNQQQVLRRVPINQVQQPQVVRRIVPVNHNNAVRQVVRTVVRTTVPVQQVRQVRTTVQQQNQNQNVTYVRAVNNQNQQHQQNIVVRRSFVANQHQTPITYQRSTLQQQQQQQQRQSVNVVRVVSGNVPNQNNMRYSSITPVVGNQPLGRVQSLGGAQLKKV